MIDHKLAEEIFRALLGQVIVAMRANREKGVVETERDLRTLISRPMWEAFLQIMGHPPGTNPTDWIGIGTIRIYGTETIVVESNEMWAVTMRRPSIH